MGERWWSTAVVDEVYLRSFADASGDGIGDSDPATTGALAPDTAAWLASTHGP